MKKKEEKNEVAPRSIDILFDQEDEEADSRSIQERTLERALDEMFSTENIDLKTDINAPQITAMTRGYIYAEVFKSRHMSMLIQHILELSVSKNREGRKEFVKLLQTSHGGGEEEPFKIMRRRFLE